MSGIPFSQMGSEKISKTNNQSAPNNIIFLPKAKLLFCFFMVEKITIITHFQIFTMIFWIFLTSITNCFNIRINN